METTTEEKIASIAFLYWLQGAIELGGVKNFNKEKMKILLQHITLTNEDHRFVVWLKGFLTAKENLDESEVKILKEELAKCFEKKTDKIDTQESLTELLKKLPKDTRDPHGPFPQFPHNPWLDWDKKLIPSPGLPLIC